MSVPPICTTAIYECVTELGSNGVGGESETACAIVGDLTSSLSLSAQNESVEDELPKTDRAFRLLLLASADIHNSPIDTALRLATILLEKFKADSDMDALSCSIEILHAALHKSASVKYLSTTLP